MRKKQFLASWPDLLEPFKCLDPAGSQVFGDLGLNDSIACRCDNLVVIQPGYTISIFSVFSCKVAATAP